MGWIIFLAVLVGLVWFLIRWKRQKPSVMDMTHEDARQFYENQRKDDAAMARKSATSQEPIPVPSTSPICPYCMESLGNRKTPVRRSSFKCKKCGGQVYGDPKQQLFASVYLTEQQKSLVDYLWQLNHWIFTAGTIEDFNWAKKQIGKGDKPNTDDVVTDTIWFLLNYNLKSLAKINPHSDALDIKFYREEVTDLIREFKGEQKQWKKR